MTTEAREYARFRMSGIEIGEVALEARLTDTYRPCPTNHADPHGRTVSIYRVEGLVPWWLTLEIHWCASGEHSDAYLRRTAAVIRPAVREDPAAPANRAFSITAVSGARRAVVNCTLSDSDCECEACGRPFGVAIYNVDVQLPSWARAEIFWCRGCEHGFVFEGPRNRRYWQVHLAEE